MASTTLTFIVGASPCTRITDSHWWKKLVSDEISRNCLFNNKVIPVQKQHQQQLNIPLTLLRRIPGLGSSHTVDSKFLLKMSSFLTEQNKNQHKWAIVDTDWTTQVSHNTMQLTARNHAVSSSYRYMVPWCMLLLWVHQFLNGGTEEACAEFIHSNGMLHFWGAGIALRSAGKAKNGHSVSEVPINCQNLILGKRQQGFSSSSSTWTAPSPNGTALEERSQRELNSPTAEPDKVKVAWRLQQSHGWMLGMIVPLSVGQTSCHQKLQGWTCAIRKLDQD